MCACEACTSASSPCIDVVSGPVSMHVVSFCVLHDLSLVPGTISAASPLATSTPIGGLMASVASGSCGVSVSFIRGNLSWFIVPFELFGRWLCGRVATPTSKTVVLCPCIGCWHCRSRQVGTPLKTVIVRGGDGDSASVHPLPPSSTIVFLLSEKA